jgi:hypothetical protein
MIFGSPRLVNLGLDASDLSQRGALKSRSPIPDCHPPPIDVTGLPRGFSYKFYLAAVIMFLLPLDAMVGNV